ncbi:UNVERIFIED_CONTAM: stard3 [Trichonephila clavipes]
MTSQLHVAYRLCDHVRRHRLAAVAEWYRGEQGPCVYIMTAADENAETCKLQWLLNTNLKGWIPQYLIDQTLSTVMMEYVQSLRKFESSKVNA